MSDEASSAANAARKQRGRPFRKGRSGNPAGRKAGSRNRASLAVEELLEGQAEKLTRKCFEKALHGDMTAMKLCLERLCPPRRDRPVTIDLPPLVTAADVVSATARIIASVASGSITPDEGTALAGLVELHRRAIETGDHEQRLASVEARLAS